MRTAPNLRLFLGALLVACTAGCGGALRSPAPAPAAERPAATGGRLALDTAASPVEFRWLAVDAVVVTPKVGKKSLADFGNFVRRAAEKRAAARLAVWDDEQAWTRAAEGSDDETVLAHKRAEYVRDESPPEPVDRFLVFGHKGGVIYQRDFRAWPLTETDP